MNSRLFRVVVVLLLLGSLSLGIRNYWQIEKLQPNELMKTFETRVTKNSCDFLHKILAKEPLRKYRYVLNQPEYAGKAANPYPNKLWFYWNDGIEKAPKIVKVCLESIKKHLHGMGIILLDQNSVNKYVDIPAHIKEKHKQGVMGEAHFADVVRTFLLRDYGGLWLDATTFLTGEIPQDIFEVEFFAPMLCDINPKRNPKFKFRNFVLPGVFCNYMLYAKRPHNYVFECMARFLTEFWKDRDWADYFLYYQFTAVAVEEDPKFYKIVLDVIRNHYYHEKDFLSLGDAVHSKFNRSEWEEMKKFPIHKIYGAKFWNDKFIEKGTFADKLLRGELD